jgi:hypothetical protein
MVALRYEYFTCHLSEVRSPRNETEMPANAQNVWIGKHMLPIPPVSWAYSLIGQVVIRAKTLPQWFRWHMTAATGLQHTFPIWRLERSRSAADASRARRPARV